LIEGAYRAFLQFGIDGLTTARICKGGRHVAWHPVLLFQEQG
jgi:hypothetical protein